jgi:hypothetical protein
MKKLPSIQFYPGDWRKDPGVQSLSFEERGIWLELLFLMHESESPGRLLLGGNPYPIDRLARLLGLSAGYLGVIITTLITLGVASRCEKTGALMNRRMVRDRGKQLKLSESGKKGGNPNFQKGKPNPYYNKGEDKGEDNQNISPSSSSSSSNTPISPKPPASPSSEEEVLQLEAESPPRPSLTPEQLEVGSWFGRRPTTAWSEKELKAWAKVPKPIDPDDWQALRWFYTQSGCDYLRRDIVTLLNNWTGEIDRAKNFNPERK